MSDDLQTEIEEMKRRAPWFEELPEVPSEAGLVQVPLGDADKAERADALAALEVERAALEDKKTREARRYTAKLNVLKAAIGRLADEVTTGTKWVDPQQPLPMRLEQAKKSRRSVQRTGQQDAAAPVEP